MSRERLERRGFTLIELLIYIALFAIAAGIMTAILISVTRVEVRESAANIVNLESNFVIQRLQRLIADSSLIEIFPPNVGITTLRLRMRDNSKDPTYITASGTVLYIQEGAAAAASSTLTSSKVSVDQITFTKLSNPPTKDVLQVDLVMSFATPKPQEVFTKTTRIAIARTTESIFDFSVSPSLSNAYELGILSMKGINWQTFGSAGSGPNQLSFPRGIFIDAVNNKAYVADYNNKRIAKFDSGSGGTTLGVNWQTFGSVGVGPNQFSFPSGIFIDVGKNKAYVIDTGNGRIAKFDSGEGGTTLGDNWQTFGSVGLGPNQFNGPGGIFIDVANNKAYVADSLNKRIAKFDSGEGGTTLGDNWQTFGSAGVGPFVAHIGIFIDVANNKAYVADSGNDRIAKFDSGEGGTTLGDNWQTFGSVGLGPNQFNGPGGIFIDVANNKAYVTDSGNDRIAEFDSGSGGTTLGDNWQTFGSAGSGPNQFNIPRGIFIDVTSNKAYVADYNNHHIAKFDYKNLWRNIYVSNLLVVGATSTNPLNPREGSIYYNTPSSTFKGFSNGVWGGLSGYWNNTSTGIYFGRSAPLPSFVGMGLAPPAPAETNPIPLYVKGDLVFYDGYGLSVRTKTGTSEVTSNVLSHQTDGNVYLGDVNATSTFVLGAYGPPLITAPTISKDGYLQLGPLSGRSGNYPLEIVTNLTRIPFAYSARFGTTSTDALTIGNGAGKINAGTIDPVYSISGQNYATYLPGMTGVKEETRGVVQIQNSKCKIQNDNLKSKICENTFDFNNLDRGSDLWLFWQTTDFGDNWKKLAVLLTPDSDQKVWYKKDPVKKTLTFYGEKEGEISYRLTAPRFDHASWSNTTKDDVNGLEVKEK